MGAAARLKRLRPILDKIRGERCGRSLFDQQGSNLSRWKLSNDILEHSFFLFASARNHDGAALRIIGDQRVPIPAVNEDYAFRWHNVADHASDARRMW